MKPLGSSKRRNQTSRSIKLTVVAARGLHGSGRPLAIACEAVRQVWALGHRRGLDVINAHERDPAVYLDGMREAVRAVASGKLDPAPLYTHAYSLEQLGDALDATRERPDGFLKAIIVM